MKRKHKLAFRVLSDPGNAYAREMNLVHGFPEDLKEVYRGFDLKLPEYNGDDAWELPLPTRMVIDRDAVIRSIDADPDYTVRPEADASLEVLRGLG